MASRASQRRSQYDRLPASRSHRPSATISETNGYDPNASYDSVSFSSIPPPPPPKSPIARIKPVDPYSAHPGKHGYNAYSEPTSRPRPAWQRFWDASSSWWIWELICIIIGLACLFAIVAICRYLQDQPIDHWHSSISPNAMISTLTTISKATVLFAVAASLSQLKWLYFESHPRRLADMDVYNEAATSPVAAVQFLFKIKANALLASTAAAIVIAALLFEPMAQQLLTYDLASIQDTSRNASIPIAQVYNQGGQFDIGMGADDSATDGYKVNDKLRIAILDGFLGSSNGAIPSSLQLPLACPSGNCTFEAFTTLGVCSSCRTAHVESAYNKSNFGIGTVLAESDPPWLTLDACTMGPSCSDIAGEDECDALDCYYTSQASNVSVRLYEVSIPHLSTPGMVTLNTSSAWVQATNIGARPFKLDDTGLSPTIAEVLIARAEPALEDRVTRPDGKSIPPAIRLRDVNECSLAWCAQSFDSVNVTSSNSTSARPDRTWPLTFKPDPNYKKAPDQWWGQGIWKAGDLRSPFMATLSIPNDTDSKTVPNKTFSFNFADAVGLAAFLGSTLNVTRTSPEERPFIFGATDSPLGISTALYNTKNITEMMDNVAQSMSNVIRLLASPDVGWSNNSVPTEHHGSVQVMATVVRVSWGWITLPALVVLASILVLVGSIVAADWHQAPLGGRNVPLWKASNIGILGHGYHASEPSRYDERGGKGVKVESKQQVKDWARDTQVQLVRDHEGSLRFTAMASKQDIMH